MISIVTLNAFNSIPEPFRYNGLTSRAQHFADAFYHSLGENIDIICLQEFMWKRKEILEGFIHHPFVTPIMRSSLFTSNARLVQSGLCILSKFPILKANATIFNGPSYHVERLCAKGAICVQVEVPSLGGSQKVRIVNTHLNAWTGDKANRARNYQINHLATWIQNLDIDYEEPIFYAGDYNIDVYEHSDLMNQIMTILQAKYVLPLKTSFSFDPAHNPLVGLDAPDEYATMSRKAGCADEYLLHGTCPCCPRQLVDLIAFSETHRMPSEVKMEILPIQSRIPFEIKIRIGVKRTIQTISDHNAVVLRAHFSPFSVAPPSASVRSASSSSSSSCSSSLSLPLPSPKPSFMAPLSSSISIPISPESVPLEYDSPRYEPTSILLQIVLTVFYTLLLLLILYSFL